MVASRPDQDSMRDIINNASVPFSTARRFGHNFRSLDQGKLSAHALGRQAWYFPRLLALAHQMPEIEPNVRGRISVSGGRQGGIATWHQPWSLTYWTA